jgi:hypothetical protein
VVTVEFVGKIIIAYGIDSSFERIFLEGADGYKVDLLGRLHETMYNYGTKVSIRYWISPESQTKDELITRTLSILDGAIDIEFDAHEYSYSEWTHRVDYVTTFTIGGHDMFKELKSRDGKYLYLEGDFAH